MQADSKVTVLFLLHRCYPGLHDLDEANEADTVTVENPAYDKSFSHKSFKVVLVVSACLLPVFTGLH